MAEPNSSVELESNKEPVAEATTQQESGEVAESREKISDHHGKDMGESTVTPFVHRTSKKKKVTIISDEDGKDMGGRMSPTTTTPPYAYSTASKINKDGRGGDYEIRALGELSGYRPSKGEVWVWFFYELSSYFINTILVPVLFPIIISQIMDLPPEPATGWGWTSKNLPCRPKQMKLYEALTYRSIGTSSTKFSPLEWTSFSWAIGLLLVIPALASISKHLDNGNKQLIIAAGAIAAGAFFCLPIGFFNVTWIFPPYIAAIVAANTIATATHTRQLGLMLRSFTGPILEAFQFPFRRRVSSCLSLYATAAGCIGAAIISSFVYHMLRHGEKVLSLWVVAIFSGLTWAAGISHVVFIKPSTTSASSSTSSIAHFFSIFRYPHAFGTLMVVFLSSFTGMCIFGGTVLYLTGQLCLQHVSILYFWLIYFLFPVVSLPLIHTLQHFIKANGVKMHLLGLFLSIMTSGFGFYFKNKIWGKGFVFIFAALQGTSVGIMHAYGRVLLVDCSPEGKEGVFSGWLAWWRYLGTFAGFAAATAIPGNISASFGTAFCTALSAVLILIYCNISDFGGSVAAGNLVTHIGNGSVEDVDLETSVKMKEHSLEGTP